MYSSKTLKELDAKHSFFVGIDSDGCAFPSMELKHKECFIPETVRHFGLQPISKYVREAAEFVNLYSKWRGANRFPALLKVMDLLSTRNEVRRSGLHIPKLTHLRSWIEQSTSLSNPKLVTAVKESNNSELQQILAWSNAVNTAIENMVRGVLPYPGVRETLQCLAKKADVIVVSATPGDALRREWTTNGLKDYVQFIAGQEMGNKSEHLSHATAGKYKSNSILMIGDAPGDWEAAKTVDALFFPILPGDEEKSWKMLQTEALEIFFNHGYAGDYQTERLRLFDELLPEIAPWEKHT